MRKPRVNLRLSPKIYGRLKTAAEPSTVTMSEIVEAALTEYLDAAGSSKDMGSLAGQLDRIEGVGGEVERDLAVVSETLALFARYWLTATPPLPEIDQGAAHALGEKRFERFLGQVSEAVARTEDQNSA